MNNKKTIATLKHFKSLNKKNTKIYINNNIINIVNDNDTQCEVASDLKLPNGLYEINDILEVLKLDPFTYEILNNNQIKLVFDGNMSKIMYFNNNEFEVEQYIKNKLICIELLKSFLLKHDFNLTNYSQASNDSRIFLNATHIYNIDNYLKVESTDGHRVNLLSYNNTDLPDFDFLISNKVTDLLGKLTNEINILKFSDNILVFEFENIKIISQKVDARYPDIDRVIPKYNDIIIQVNRLEMLEAIKKLGKPLSDLKSLYLRINKNELILDNESTNLSISCIVEKNINNFNVNVAFNQNYILDLFQHATVENLTFYLVDNARSVLVKHNSEDYSLQQVTVIMPLRT